MARPRKTGLDYFPLDTDVFWQDTRVRLLNRQYGPTGVATYVYLLCRCYGGSGYYLPLTEELYDAAACDLGLEPETLKEILALMANRGLADGRLLGQGIFTSHGVQRRYQEAIRARMSRRSQPLVVEDDYWLLPPEETEGYIFVPGRQAAVQSAEAVEVGAGVAAGEAVEPVRAIDAPAKGEVIAFSTEKPHKEKEKKEEKNKFKREHIDRTAQPSASGLTPPPMPATADQTRPVYDDSEYEIVGTFKNVRLLPIELATLKRRYADWQARIDRLSAWLADSGQRCESHFATLVSWAQQEAEAKRASEKLKANARPGSFELASVRRLQAQQEGSA